jgi:hypothetical protein
VIAEVVTPANARVFDMCPEITRPDTTTIGHDQA